MFHIRSYICISIDECMFHNTYIYIYVHTYVCMYVCVYIYIYICFISVLG